MLMGYGALRAGVARARTIARTGLVTAVVALAAGGCGGGSKGPGGTPASGQGAAKGGILRVGMTADQAGTDTSLNLFAITSGASFFVRQLVYPALVQVKGSSLEPAWAERWESSEGGRRYTFHLRKGKWSDGTPLTSEDAVWTANVELRYAHGPASLLSWVLNGVTSVTAPDPQTLVITYDKPIAEGALTQLTYFSVMPKHVWAAHVGAKGGGLRAFRPEDHLPAVSGGPFIASKFDPNDTMIFKPNPGFYGDPPNVDLVGIQVFHNDEDLVQGLKSGSVDWGLNAGGKVARSLRGDDGLTTVDLPGNSMESLAINPNPRKPDHPELRNAQVREAMSLAIDRKRLVDVSLSGFGAPARSLVPLVQESWIPADLQAPQYDPAKANQLLDQLGFRRGPDGVRATPRGAMRYDMLALAPSRDLEILQENLRAIGIALRPVIDQDAWIAVGNPHGKYLDFDTAVFGYEVAPDPTDTLTFFTCGEWSGENFAGYCDTRYDALFQQQLAEQDPSRRKSLIGQMQRLVARNRAFLPLYYVGKVQVFSKRWARLEADRQGPTEWTLPHRLGG